MISDNFTEGQLIVISAPSGTGKTSVLSEVFKKHPELLFSVSVTTRQPRRDEQDGVNYHFVSESEFDELIEKEAFAEWAVVYGHRYGTLKSAIREALDNNRMMIFDTDTVGAFNIKKHFPGAVLIFILPPSPEVLSKRLQSRKTESVERIRQRLEDAPKELSRIKEYDYIVLNNEISVAASQVSAIIQAESLKSKKQLLSFTEWRKYINGY